MSASRSSELSIQQLEVLAEDALSSPSPEVRQSAMDHLRFLSAFDEWDFLKSIFMTTRNPSLLCVGIKAIHFVVKNELGPQERAEVQEFMLQYIQQNGVQLPRYLVKMCLAVYATAFNLNWRLMVLTDSDDAEGNLSSLGAQTEESLRRYLTPALMIDCMKEVVHAFAAEDIRTNILSTQRETFTKSVLPHFFRFAEGATVDHGVLALELLTLILESVPKRTNAPLIQLTLTTDDSIYVAPGIEWMPSLRRAVQNCGEYVVANPNVLEDEMSAACLSLLRTASCVMVGDWGGRQVLRDDVSEFVQNLLNLSNNLLQLFQVTRLVPILRCAIALMVNCMERDEASFYDLDMLAQMVHNWASVSIACCERWTEEEAECRQAFLHFFFLAARMLPKEGSNPMLEQLTGDDTRRSSTEDTIRRVFDAYFRSVIAKSHLAEDSYELRCAEALVLHSEEHLQPMAELLICERLRLSPILLEEMRRSEEQYRACVAMRRGETVPEDMLLSLMVVSTDFVGALSTEDIVLFLTNVVLSRIASIVTTVGLALHCSSLDPSDPLTNVVLTFLLDLIAPDDDVTDALLQCMRISCSPTQDRGDGKPQGTKTQHKLHLGVLRSLFHFARCIAESSAAAEGANAYAELIAYALTRHSECIPLVSDATLLLTQLLADCNTALFVVRAERMIITIRAVVEGRVVLLQPRDAVSLSQSEQAAREAILTALVTFLEFRGQMTGYGGSIASLECMLDAALRCLTHMNSATQCFRDLTAILSGVLSKVILEVLLDWLVEHSEILAGGMKNIRFADARPSALHFISMLGIACDKLISVDNLQPLVWGVASFGYNAIRYYLETLRVPRTGGGYYFPQISELEMYNVCSWIGCTCAGSWINLGVMMFYGDHAVDESLLLAAEALLTIPVEVLVSDETKRHRVFNAVSVCLDFPLDGFSAALWPRLLDYLVHCIAYRFSHLALGCIWKLLQVLCPTPVQENRDVSARTLQMILREVAVALSTTDGLHESTHVLSFEVMRACYVRDCEGCESVLENLLSFCSAYHRVRLRSILMMLRGGSGAGQAASSFRSVFGTSNKQQTLAAW